MNSKFITVFLAVVAIILLGYYFLSRTNQSKKSLSLNPYTNTSISTTYPVSPDKTGVRSVFIVYDFYGRITKLEKIGSETKITLDNSDSQTPDFVSGDFTSYFKASGKIGETPEKASLADLKEGDYVDLSTVYNPKEKTWQLKGVTIQTNPFTAPTASPSK